MSTNALEDGEIASEHDSLPPSPQNATFGDLNDEKTIDKMIEESNGSAPKEAVNKSERKPLQQQQQNKERRARKRYTQRSTKSTSSSTSTTRQNHISRDATSMSSWQKSGSNERMRRPPPSDAVMFPPPPNIQPLNSINCNPDIVRLQSLVNHGNFFPPPPLPSQQVCYFPSPASIYPHIPPLLSPAAPNCSYRGGNYEEVGMEISDDRRTPEEPPSNFFNDSSAAPPPVQIPLNTLLPPPPPPPILPPLRVERAELKDSVNEEEPDADALRQLLLDQMSQNKKRVAPDSSGGKSNSPVKKQKKSSSVSASATPLAPLPPAVPPAPAAEAPATPSPKPTPSVPHPESRQSTPTSTSTNAKSKTKTRPQTPVDSPASPTPSEHAPLRALEIPVLSPKASRESQSGKQKELDSRIRDLTEFIKDSQSKMRKEHEEMKSIMEKYNVLKASMGKRRDEIKGAHAEKRELQNQLEALEFEELDNLFDDIE
uniref:Uncharacterized protein n=1 Tax=Caenorhabditis japonica TaxID=281687 RepID=A0A8R1DL39_CAEJA